MLSTAYALITTKILSTSRFNGIKLSEKCNNPLKLLCSVDIEPILKSLLNLKAFLGARAREKNLRLLSLHY